MIENKLTKKRILIISFIVLVFIRLLFLCTHIGFFAFDEFYHISTLNEQYITSYDRASYINWFVKLVCMIVGQSDFTVKLVPFICGLISDVCAVYLLYNIYENPRWIFTISSILACMPYVLYNHFYIRMYIFLEMIVMVDCVLFFHGSKEYEIRRKIKYILPAIIFSLPYILLTTDFSSITLIILLIIASLFLLCEEKAKQLYFRYSWAKKLLIFSCILISFLILSLIGIKEEIIKIPGSINIMALKYTGTDLENLLLNFYHADSAVFLIFFFSSTIFVSVPFILSLSYSFINDIKKLKTLCVIALVPALGFLLCFYNSHLLRCYIAFWPILCILSYFVFDKIQISPIIHVGISIICIVLTLNIQPEFWSCPQIPYETRSSNLGQVVEYGKELENMGYEISTMMTYKTQSAYFDLLNVDVNLNREDLKENNNFNDDDAYYWIKEAIESMINSGKKYVIITDSTGSIVFDSMKNLIDSNSCDISEFDGEMKVIRIN